MNVLMIEEASPIGAKVADSVRQSGGSVYCCHNGPTNERDFACDALLGGVCPLEIHPIDAVVAVKRSDAGIVTRANTDTSPPLLYDEGIACSIRRHIPLVMVCDTGDPYGGPFDQWIEAASVHDEVSEVLQSIVSGPSDTYTQLASKALVTSMLIRNLDTSKAKATVIRRNGCLTVTLTIREELDQLTIDSLSVSVHRALRDFDPWISCIDISVKVP